MSPRAVAVGVSGGVDSAVAALLLRDAGADVHAVHMRLWADEAGVRDAHDCAEARARAVAGKLGVPFSVLDLRAGFEEHVVEPFVAAYLDGLTPNPCVACNPFRFARLADWACGRGIGRVASGHYARVERRGSAASTAVEDGPCGVVPASIRLVCGRDRRKDQSYMLARLSDDLLARLELPLGDLTKAQVRGLARDAGLDDAVTDESQEVCFAPHGYRRFLEGRGVPAHDGRIVDEGGREVGRHRGQWRYTVGQRRGLGVGGGRPLFVLTRRPDADEVVVGPRHRLATDEIDVVELDARAIGVWEAHVAGPLAVPVVGDAGDEVVGRRGAVSVRLRYRSPAVEVGSMCGLPGPRLRLRLARPFCGAAPGQAAVLYDGGRVIGCGTIGTRERV